MISLHRSVNRRAIRWPERLNTGAAGPFTHARHRVHFLSLGSQSLLNSTIKPFQHGRFYSSVIQRPAASEIVNLPVRYSSITLNVLEPISGPKFETVLLYLGAGPFLGQANQPGFDEPIIAALGAASNATIIRIGYQAEAGFPFPIAVHDVLAGYDWAIERIAERNEDSQRSAIGKIGVVGQLFGGSLATSLALTESRRGVWPARVQAAAVNNPITDWVVPDREKLELAAAQFGVLKVDDADPDTENIMARSNKSKRKGPALSSWQKYKDSNVLGAKDLLKARKSIFTKEDSFYDVFASPIHFFRTPGIEFPLPASTLPDSETDEPPDYTLSRKSRRVFPPAGSNIMLPHYRMTTGEESILASQNEEFILSLYSGEVSRHLKTHGLRASHLKHLDEDQQNEVDFISEQADVKFKSYALPGVGLWGVGPGNLWRSDAEMAGDWLRQVLTV
ncbi:hypothetical protein BT63DRAFT_232963 [Microthyrium microscopicum]|uniref:Alpha/beta hydrolase fold-3 domain-containing protein n=1 Tax=Microthyrium microscopicum TaxID=703497 RepID=A0A6A6UF52_9PEZI|nr:hypothetical protein BT63DRAFT_232963 [Microthyrium microscopicum]